MIMKPPARTTTSRQLMTPAQIAEAQKLAREWKPKVSGPVFFYRPELSRAFTLANYDCRGRKLFHTQSG